MNPSEGSMMHKPGVYSLRSNGLDGDADAMLTDVKSVFRSLKSALALRPIYHCKERRGDGHLFISVIAYQAIQVLRTLLRITTAFARSDGRRVDIRNTALPNADQAAIYHAMQITPRLRTCAGSIV